MKKAIVGTITIDRINFSALSLLIDVLIKDAQDFINEYDNDIRDVNSQLIIYENARCLKTVAGLCKRRAMCEPLLEQKNALHYNAVKLIKLIPEFEDALHFSSSISFRPFADTADSYKQLSTIELKEFLEELKQLIPQIDSSFIAKLKAMRDEPIFYCTSCHKRISVGEILELYNGIDTVYPNYQCHDCLSNEINDIINE
jgi:hypothetical protein